MNYIKKLCILKQVASGFAADGREVSALLTAESLGGRLTLTLAPIGFAPLAAGRYRCVVADADGRREAFDLPVPAGAAVRRASGLDIARGLGCAVCFVSGKATPVAFGKVGEGQYDPRAMCAAEEDAAPAPRDSRTGVRNDLPGGTNDSYTESGTPSSDPPEATPYDDEMLATENYFERENDEGNPQNDVPTPSEPTEAEVEKRENAEAEKDEDAPGQADGTGENEQTLFRLHGKKDAEPCYYDRVRADLDALFARHPAERELADCIPYSRWAKVTFARNKYYAVGVIFDEKKPKYICYGVPAETHGEPPSALKGFCSFLPLSVFDTEGRGYWMMFQDAETGQCVRIKKA